MSALSRSICSATSMSRLSDSTTENRCRMQIASVTLFARSLAKRLTYAELIGKVDERPTEEEVEPF